MIRRLKESVDNQYLTTYSTPSGVRLTILDDEWSSGVYDAYNIIDPDEYTNVQQILNDIHDKTDGAFSNNASDYKILNVSQRIIRSIGYQLVTENGVKPTSEEISRYKRGEIKLYEAYVSFCLEIEMERHYITRKEAEDLGFTV